ncbi:MAG: FAD-dependent oxidoreductase, partial [Desulfobacula sp.]|nr:FAD-dependent oxidoreductase [Desulfobacula sp.]
MAGQVTPESIIVPDKNLEDAGINVVVAEVTKVDAETRKVIISDGREFDYDKLLLATGSNSFIPSIEGKDLNGVMTLRGLSDAKKIRDFGDDNAPKKIVFIGAGFISMEIASLLEAHHPDTLDITVVESLDHSLPLMLDGDMADSVTKYF